MTSFPIANMRDTVTIERDDHTTSPLGSLVHHWVTVATVRAWVEQLTGKEGFYISHLGHEQTYKVHLRYIEGLDESMRLNWEGKLLKIQYITPDRLRRELEIGVTVETY